MCLCISVCARPCVCVQLRFKCTDIISLDGEVHFLSCLYTSSVLSIQNIDFIPFISPNSVHSISGSSGSILLSSQCCQNIHCHIIAMYVCVYVEEGCVRACVCNMCIYVCVYTYMCVYSFYIFYLLICLYFCCSCCCVCVCLFFILCTNLVSVSFSLLLLSLF